MPKASSRKSTAESISKQTLMTTVSNLSKQYRLLPCFCEQDPLRMMKQKSTSSVQKMSSFTTEQQNSNATNQTTKKKKKKKKRTTTTTKKKTRTTKSKRTRNKCSPFPDPNIFHSMPKMQDSDEVTLNNIHENHLCCKPISSIQGLSSSDQKKLIEHDCLTLISLLPIYLGAQGNFVGEIREKTNISHEGALELDRLMNEWSSTRLFIGANSHYKTLTQKI